MSDFNTLIYEMAEPGIARIWLNRPDKRNAQDTRMLYELNDAFDRAIEDDTVKVIVLAAKGSDFSAGHDFYERSTDGLETKRVGTWKSGDASGAEAHFCREKEIYQHFCLRWRDLSKPVIASVHGRVIAGGLMLVWPCDLVIASEEATFQDNTLFMGIPGVEYFAHIWELGIRKAKEFLLTGTPMTAAEALQAGMVNRVVPLNRLEKETLELARVIADKPAFAVKLAKELINAAYSGQGFENIQKAAFNAHHLAHTHYRLSQEGAYIDRAFLARLQEKNSQTSDDEEEDNHD